MHGICAFLMKVPFAVDRSDALDRELRAWYANDQCGPDNWWRPIEAVRPDGRLTSFGDHGGPAAALPAEGRWSGVRGWMLEETVWDYLRAARGAAPDLAAELEGHFRFPRTGRLAEDARRVLTAMAAVRERVASVATVGDAARRRSTLGVIEELLRDTVDELCPFSQILETPYVYRAYDIRDDLVQLDESLIYLVDMHT